MNSYAKNKLTDDELFSQMRCARSSLLFSWSFTKLWMTSLILFAGHESISLTLGWILLELARHPEMQTRLRAEIRETEAAIRVRGDTHFTGTDFEAMPYAMAVIT